ncbi:hypothetical protein LSAT2_021377 [Lamellibrachia satsuma]|nr:hypothetical protein LSAT2_021377 [Lamellibrachia satsuma]
MRSYSHDVPHLENHNDVFFGDAYGDTTGEDEWRAVVHLFAVNGSQYPERVPTLPRVRLLTCHVATNAGRTQKRKQKRTQKGTRKRTQEMQKMAQKGTRKRPLKRTEHDTEEDTSHLMQLQSSSTSPKMSTYTIRSIIYQHYQPTGCQHTPYEASFINIINQQSIGADRSKEDDRRRTVSDVRADVTKHLSSTLIEAFILQHYAIDADRGVDYATKPSVDASIP